MVFTRLFSCVFALSILGAVELSAQSFTDVLSQTGRAISKTVRSAERALSKSTTKKSKSDREQLGDSELDSAQAPPLPVRRPRPWDFKKQHASPLDTRPADAPAISKPVLQVSKRPARVPTPVGVPSDVKIKSPAHKQTKKTDAQHVSNEEAKPADEPEADVWSPVEINVAQARCRLLLKRVDAVTISQPAIKKGPCGDAAPVKLISIGRSPEVSLSPPAVVNCQMVQMLHTWLEEDLQPLAKKHLGAPIVTLETMSSYSCRNAYGRTSTRLSEHGRANALDIGGFLTTHGKRTRLLAHWGPNHRDVTVAKKKTDDRARLVAQKQREARAVSKKTARKLARPEQGSVTRTASGSAAVHKISLETGVPLPVRGTLIEGVGEKAPKTGRTKAALAEKPGRSSARLGGPKPGNRENGKTALKTTKSKVSSVGTEKRAKVLRPSNSKQARFLRAAYKSGCRKFGTMLGPEANEAHRNHFHVDLAPRKHGNYCR